MSAICRIASLKAGKQKEERDLSAYRVSSLIRRSPPLYDHHKILGRGLKGRQFLMRIALQ